MSGSVNVGRLSSIVSVGLNTASVTYWRTIVSETQPGVPTPEPLPAKLNFLITSAPLVLAPFVCCVST